MTTLPASDNAATRAVAATEPIVVPTRGAVLAWAPRYELLHALRGPLALWVVLGHMTKVQFAAPNTRSVFFFVISGYAIFAAAESALRKAREQGDPRVLREVATFLRRRFVRIWPTYALSLVYLALIAWIFAGWADVVTFRADRSWLIWIKNLALVAWTGMLTEPRHMPAMNPDQLVGYHWTLAYEAQFYLVVAGGMALAVWRGIGLRWTALWLTLAGVLSTLLSPRLRFGLLPDYALCFSMGACVYFRLCGGLAPLTRRVIDVSLAGVAIVLAWTIWGNGAEFLGLDFGPIRRQSHPYYATFLALVAALALIVLRGPSEGWSWVRSPLFNGLGRISFSLFLIHGINLGLVAVLAERSLPAGTPLGVNISLQLGYHVAIAVAFWWACERPFERRRPVH